MQLGLPFDQEEAPEFYFVRHRRARRYLLRVEVDGRVRVTIPRGGSRREAEAFTTRNLEWVRRHRARLTRTPLTADDKRALQEQAARELPARLMELAALQQLQVARVTVRSQRSRWGSCGRDGHISVNWRLVRMPDWVRDYVLIHELMHLRCMDHSPKYWKLVAEACPEYEAARRWLRVYGRSL